MHQRKSFLKKATSFHCALSLEFPLYWSLYRSHRRPFSGCRSETRITEHIAGAGVLIRPLGWELRLVVLCVIVAVVVVVVGVKKIPLKEGSPEAVFVHVHRDLVRHQVGGPFNEICKPVEEGHYVSMVCTYSCTSRVFWGFPSSGLAWKRQGSHRIWTFLGTGAWTRSSRGWNPDCCSVSSAPPVHGGFLPPPASDIPPQSTGAVDWAFGECAEFSYIEDQRVTGLDFISAPPFHLSVTGCFQSYLQMHPHAAAPRATGYSRFLEIKAAMMMAKATCWIWIPK